jgi:hypothetical protein
MSIEHSFSFEYAKRRRTTVSLCFQGFLILCNEGRFHLWHIRFHQWSVANHLPVSSVPGLPEPCTRIFCVVTPMRGSSSL